jgi:hypothetical protein
MGSGGVMDLQFPWSSYPPQIRAAALASVLFVCGFVLLDASVARAQESCTESGQAIGDYIAVGIQCYEAPNTSGAGTSAIASTSDRNDAPPYVQYRWVSVCAGAGPTVAAGQSADCGQANTCPDPADRVWRLWGRKPSGDWDPFGTQCAGPQGPPPAQTPRPQVTPGLVLNALRQIGLPALEAHTQPEDKTLVNFATIFYAEPQTLVRTLTLLGQQVHVEATPTSFVWRYGDGTSTTTSTPGAPYPAKDITHNNADAHTTVQTSVDVTYSARFQVGNGGWQDIPETVTIVGPQSALRISEATAVLSGDYN